MTIKERLININQNINQKHPKLIHNAKHASNLFFALCGTAGAIMFFYNLIKDHKHHNAVTWIGVALIALAVLYFVIRFGVYDIIHNHRRKQETSKNLELDCLQGQEHVDRNRRRGSDSSNESLKCSDLRPLLESLDSVKESKLR